MEIVHQIKRQPTGGEKNLCQKKKKIFATRHYFLDYLIIMLTIYTSGINIWNIQRTEKTKQ